ncbi:acylneuraminate cytidylyltransferase family protein [Actinokineospora xionganensis]|uniref:Acylneuraminate cytidylyltransferase family protein n=1 Tax=Actinokineospora xionganensis TaxID=2684470 RepID=A0ABR7LEH9_9PSEU|nr:acylneuraminate cytidylyltransferase family protein [Actinokineospora xionganensis]MBC6451111.1 acylneuraminate cytidylyltransferase family protein [Actinokineospora xionganensis]
MDGRDTGSEAAVRRLVVAVVPARGGSVGFPGKNLAPFLGRPLVAHAVATAAAAQGVDRVVVSTDDPDIAAAGAAAGAETVRRPDILAAWDSRTVDAVTHAATALGLADDTLIVLIQPTSPLRTAADIEECLALHANRATGSVVQMTTSDEHHPWKACVLVDGVLRPARDWPDLEAPRQALPPVLRPTGGVYVVGTGDLRAHNRFFVPEVLPQVVDPDRAVDIDREDDLVVARRRAEELGLRG